MLIRAARVVRRINVNAFDLPRELLFERLESKQVIPEDESVIEQVVVGDPVRRMVGLLRVFQQNPRLQLRPVLLADLSEFEFLLSVAHDYLLPDHCAIAVMTA